MSLTGTCMSSSFHSILPRFRFAAPEVVEPATLALGPASSAGPIECRAGDAPARASVGHRVQDLLGILRLKAEGRIYSIQTELQADCLAGIYMYSLSKKGRLERDDVRAALTIAARGTTQLVRRS